MNSPEIDTKLFVPQEITQWPTIGDNPRRAAVSSYGAVGNQRPRHPGASSRDPEPMRTGRGETELTCAGVTAVPCPSTSADELRRTAGRLADWVQAHHDDVALADLAYTLTRRRAHRPSALPSLRAAGRNSPRLCVRSPRAIHRIEAAIGRDDRGPVWVFSGQGSQWAPMGAQLLATEPVFAATVAQVEPVIARECGFSVTDAMSSPRS